MKQGNHGNSHGHKEPNTGEGKDRNLHNPIEDRLIPLEPLDLSKVHSIDGLVRAIWGKRPMYSKPWRWMKTLSS